MSKSWYERMIDAEWDQAYDEWVSGSDETRVDLGGGMVVPLSELLEDES